MRMSKRKKASSKIGLKREKTFFSEAKGFFNERSS